MENKRTKLIVLLLLVCQISFAQHPSSHGGNPFYWALVGGVGALISYFSYLLFSWIVGLISQVGKKSEIKENTVRDNNNEQLTVRLSDSLQTYSEKGNNDSSLERKHKYSGKTPLTWLEKKISLFIAIYVLLLFVSVVVINNHVNNKRNNLYVDLIEQIEESFKKNGVNNSVDAIAQYPGDKFVISELNVPQLPQDKNDREQRYWNNIYSGIEHVYKLNDDSERWIVWGMSLQPVLWKDGYWWKGIQEYEFFPYSICVPYGANFNSTIAAEIIKKSLDKVDSNIDNYNKVQEVISLSNEYYNIIGYNIQYNKNDSNPVSDISFYNSDTGVGPIFENGFFTGIYRFGLIKVGQYRVLIGYRNRTTWKPVEKGGFNASFQDKTLLIGIIFIILSIILIILIRSDIQLLKRDRLVLTESLKERLLRYTNPLDYMGQEQAQKVLIARDLNEKLLAIDSDDPIIEDMANEVKEKLEIFLINGNERTYLTAICKSILKKANKKGDMSLIKDVNNTLVLLSDIGTINGSKYKEIVLNITRFLKK